MYRKTIRIPSWINNDVDKDAYFNTQITKLMQQADTAFPRVQRLSRVDGVGDLLFYVYFEPVNKRYSYEKQFQAPSSETTASKQTKPGGAKSGVSGLAGSGK